MADIISKIPDKLFSLQVKLYVNAAIFSLRNTKETSNCQRQCSQDLFQRSISEYQFIFLPNRSIFIILVLHDFTKPTSFFINCRLAGSHLIRSRFFCIRITYHYTPFVQRGRNHRIRRISRYVKTRSRYTDIHFVCLYHERFRYILLYFKISLAY